MNELGGMGALAYKVARFLWSEFLQSIEGRLSVSMVRACSLLTFDLKLLIAMISSPIFGKVGYDGKPGKLV